MLTATDADLTAGLSTHMLSSDVAFAVATARRAGDLALEAFRSRSFATRTKTDGSPVTEADTAAEGFIRTEIGATYPSDAIVGEEEGSTEGSSDRCWILDPIDGTRAFARGVPTFATLLALQVGDALSVGVIYLPALGELLVAAVGGGTWLNGAPCTVASGDHLTEYVASTSGFDYWMPEGIALLRSRGLAMRTWGDAWGHALVASGRVDMMIDPIAWEWDLAAPAVITREAGGVFYGLDGTGSHTTGGAVSATPHLAQDALDVLQAAAPI